MAQHHQDSAISTRVQDARPLHLFLVDHWRPEIGRVEQQGSLEFRRRYTEDGKWMLVQLNDTADHTAIILKMAVPICVGEHDIRSAVGTMLIGAVEEAAEMRLN